LSSEHHRSYRIGWLRAAVLGANDGIVSTASLILGVASAQAAREDILIAGIAALVAGAMSMAAGEYVSVSSQADTEKADLALEKLELENNLEFEKEELTKIYIQRGLDRALAAEVSEQLMAHDALGAHARDELGIFEAMKARPLQAAFASACTFAMGGILPLLIVFIASMKMLIPMVSCASLLYLAFLGGVAAKIGGANIWKGAARVIFWGAFAMGLTAMIGAAVGKVI